VAPELNNTQNGFEFKKRVSETTVPEVAASFSFITDAFLRLQALKVGVLGGAEPRVLLRPCPQLLVIGGMQR